MIAVAPIFLMLFLLASPPPAGGEAAVHANLQPRAVRGVSSDEIQVFVEKDDDWSKPVLEALPAFAAVGRAEFGPSLPGVSLYLSSDEARYRVFTSNVFGHEGREGTGGFHIVAMCLPCGQRRPEEKETTAIVLHEFGHAWMNTYLRETYHRREYISEAVRRPYLDEGTADYFAGLWDSEFISRRREWILIGRVARHRPPPTFAELQTRSAFFEQGDREVHYWISALLVARMLGPAPGAVGKIRVYLDQIGRGNTPDRAWEAATGKSAAKEYAALVDELWSSSTKSNLGCAPSAQEGDAVAQGGEIFDDQAGLLAISSEVDGSANVGEIEGRAPKHRYRTFYQSVKKSVGEHWEPEVPMRARDPEGKIYGLRPRYSEVRVWVRRDGRLTGACLTLSSGLKFLDDLALEAFRNAQPFLRPPPAILGPDGTTDFRFGLLYDLGPKADTSRHGAGK
jgi:TonB family protein